MSRLHERDTVTRQEAFSQGELQRLRTRAAKMVADGVLSLEDCSLDGELGEDQQLAEGENEMFREFVREELDDVPDRGDQQPDDTVGGWGPTEVDFTRIWDEFSLQDEVSRTQLLGALAYSDFTAFGEGGAQSAIEYGVEAGDLIDIPRNLAPVGGDTIQASGLMFARAER